jgi:hypothetical protein
MKAAPAPWTMEIVRENIAAVYGANRAFVAHMSVVNARLVVEAVNSRMEVERVVYAPRYEWDIDAVVRGAYFDDTL